MGVLSAIRVCVYQEMKQWAWSSKGPSTSQASTGVNTLAQKEMLLDAGDQTYKMLHPGESVILIKVKESKLSWLFLNDVMLHSLNVS